jgi:hypothetical protein
LPSTGITLVLRSLGGFHLRPVKYMHSKVHTVHRSLAPGNLVLTLIQKYPRPGWYAPWMICSRVIWSPDGMILYDICSLDDIFPEFHAPWTICSLKDTLPEWYFPWMIHSLTDMLLLWYDPWMIWSLVPDGYDPRMIWSLDDMIPHDIVYRWHNPWIIWSWMIAPPSMIWSRMIWSWMKCFLDNLVPELYRFLNIVPEIYRII